MFSLVLDEAAQNAILSNGFTIFQPREILIVQASRPNFSRVLNLENLMLTLYNTNVV